MDQAITCDEVHLAEGQPRILETITPQHVDTDAKPNVRTPPNRPADVLKPPPPPKITISKNSIGLPTPVIRGAAPDEVGFGKVEPINFDPVAISDRDAQPIREPAKDYPERALMRGIEGNCEVYLDVDVRGRPYNIKAVCTDNVFVRSAERAVSKAEFAPKIVRGQPTERANVVYPIEYTIKD
jgi:protein TonB